MDYDADGASELDFNAPEYHALLKPADGGTMAMLDFRPCAATLINSMQRRPEAYHARLRVASRVADSSAKSIHDQTKVKEPGLERFLRYDRWPRHAFRVLIFDPARTQSDYEMLQLQEHPDFAGGEYVVRSSAPHHAELLRKGNLELEAADAGQSVSLTKYFSFSPAPRGCEVACEITLKLKQPLANNFAIGIESIINLLAPTEPDRFFETPAGQQHNLRFSGVIPGPMLRMHDQWQRVRISLHAPSSQEFWVAPIETVSESEEGFERVYQGSQILAVWRPELTTQKSFTARLIWRVETLES
jgi:4-alpha-glucanotransferase